MKYHYYAISFIGDQDGSLVNWCGYMGWKTKGVNMTRLKEVRAVNNIPYGASLLAVSYLGHMSRDDMTGE